MGRRRKKTQKTDGTNVQGSEEIFTIEANEKIGIIQTLHITIKHFFGAFPPSIQAYY